MPRKGTYSNTKASGSTIEVSDFATIRQEAKESVESELGKLARPDDRVARAAEIIRQADVEIATDGPDREKATASLWFYEQAMGLPKVLGIYPTAYREILSKALYGDPKKKLPSAGPEELKKLAEAANVPHVPDAREKLPKLARIVAAAQARRHAAVPFMQDAALALSQEPYGWDAARIAEHADVQKAIIYQHWRAAKNRR
ncbi:hypothetical protein ACIO3O_36915 [Streptomyces sp. NPDC087440]|uniref:hypothetical protein n=1 Tax=Streptomyces sp. NPDC087440 TaxID=3365790 RepID=UPI0037F665FA